MRLGSFVRAIRSYIPERLDPSEPDVRVTYRYHEGERASATDPAYPAEIDILQVVRVKDTREVLSTYAADRDCGRVGGLLPHPTIRLRPPSPRR